MYVERRKGEAEIFNIKGYSFFSEIKDPEIIDRFNNTYSQSVTTQTAKQVLSRMAGRNGWSQDDEVVLVNTSAESFYDLFKSETGSHLSSIVATCLKFGQLENASDQQREIANRATEALRKIASENKVNKIRVKRFGVNLEDA